MELNLAFGKEYIFLQANESRWLEESAEYIGSVFDQRVWYLSVLEKKQNRDKSSSLSLYMPRTSEFINVCGSYLKSWPNFTDEETEGQAESLAWSHIIG